MLRSQVKALWKMKAAKDPKRKDNLKDPIVAPDKFLSAWRFRVKVDYWPETCCGIGLLACDREGSGMVPEMRNSVRLRTASTHWNVLGKYEPHAELFFYLWSFSVFGVPKKFSGGIQQQIFFLTMDGL